MDDDDFTLVADRVWRAQYLYYKGRRVGISAVVSGNVRDGTYVKLHRLLVNPRDDQVVDHADGNPLNNCRANLRACSHSENMRNRRTARSNRCGLKGVYQDGRTNRWRAEIVMDGVRHRLGSFPTKYEAAAAYREAAVRLHGEFARAA